MSLLSSISPEFVAYSPDAAARWYGKAVAGQAVTAEEHNSVAIAIGLQRDVYANQASMVVGDGINIPSIPHGGVSVYSVGWSERVEPVANESPAQRAQREAQFHACTFALWRLRDSFQVVPSTSPAGAVRELPSGIVGVWREVQDAVVMPERVPAGSGILESVELARELQNVFSPQAMQGGVSTRAVAIASTTALSGAYDVVTSRAIMRAKVAAAAFVAFVVAVKVLG